VTRSLEQLQLGTTFMISRRASGSPPAAVGSLESYERLTPPTCILAGSVCATFNRGRLSCPW
jgi:hypothetical protein